AVEHELAVLVGRDHAPLAELLDEAAEQRAVEELGRVELMQQREALRGQPAERFELAGRERVRAVLHEQREADVIALDRGQEVSRERAQTERRIALAGMARDYAA